MTLSEDEDSPDITFDVLDLQLLVTAFSNN